MFIVTLYVVYFCIGILIAYTYKNEEKDLKLSEGSYLGIALGLQLLLIAMMLSQHDSQVEKGIMAAPLVVLATITAMRSIVVGQKIKKAKEGEEEKKRLEQIAERNRVMLLMIRLGLWK